MGGTTNHKRSMTARAMAVLLAALAALFLGATAGAQTSSDAQYGAPTAPSGPLAGLPVQVLVDAPPVGVVSPGDLLRISGNYVISPGASVTLQDADGTQGTLIDGQNANIYTGSVMIRVTGYPFNQTGGNGVLNTRGLRVVASTGIWPVSGTSASTSTASPAAGAGAAPSSGAATTAASSGAAIGVLPETGGTASAVLLGAGIVACGGGLIGLAAVRRRSSRGGR